nr:hypothetical protein [Streptomyces albospinus]
MPPEHLALPRRRHAVREECRSQGEAVEQGRQALGLQVRIQIGRQSAHAPGLGQHADDEGVHVLLHLGCTGPQFGASAGRGGEGDPEDRLFAANVVEGEELGQQFLGGRRSMSASGARSRSAWAWMRSPMRRLSSRMARVINSSCSAK